MRNSLARPNSGLESVEERVSKCVVKSAEIIQSEQQKAKTY